MTDSFPFFLFILIIFFSSLWSIGWESRRNGVWMNQPMNENERKSRVSSSRLCPTGSLSLGPNENLKRVPTLLLSVHWFVCKWGSKRLNSGRNPPLRIAPKRHYRLAVSSFEWKESRNLLGKWEESSAFKCGSFDTKNVFSLQIFAQSFLCDGFSLS